MTTVRISVLLLLMVMVGRPALAQHEHHHTTAPQQSQPQKQTPMPDMPGMQMPAAPPQSEQQSMPGMQMPMGKPESEAAQSQAGPAVTVGGKPVPLQVPPTTLPGLAAAQAAAGPKMRLEQFEAMALDNNPTLRQASSEIRTAEGRRRQAGLWPNPIAGYSGEEIRGGRLNGGQQGFFVEQSVVLGGKLAAGRRVFQQEVRLAEAEREEQKLRVANAVRLGFYQVLASQERLANERYLAQLAAQNLGTSQRLQNLGQMDETEVLQATIERDRAELEVVREENNLRRTWSSLAATVGRPELPLAEVEGRLEEGWPALEEQPLVEAFLTRSPAVRIAAISTERAQAEVSRARRQAIPDLRLRGGLQQNRELLEPTTRLIGLQGFAEAGVDLPIFNRNQGNVQAAKASVDRSQQEQRRVELVLQQRAIAVFQTYRDARVTVERYQKNILPNSRRAYDLMLARWGQMGASYPQVLLAQRTYFQAQADYINALEAVWTRSIALQGFLLTDGLEAPTRPSEVDQPMRELNVPTTMSGGER